MNEIPGLVVPALAGVGLGAFFFGGLWWTVRRGVASGYAGVWFAASSLVRMAVALAGMYLVTGAQWKKLLACVFGFIVARALVTRLAGPPLAALAPETKEDGDASES